MVENAEHGDNETRRVGGNRENRRGEGWVVRGERRKRDRQIGSNGRGTQFERVASVGGFNEVSCNYMH